MSISRRKFLKSAFGSVVLIGLGNGLQSFVPQDAFLPARRKVRLRFALASDGHFGQPNTEYELHHKEMTAWLNKEEKKRGLDFVVINGDIFHDDPAQLPLVKKVWDDLKAPYYVTHGNHDMVEEQAWQKTWGMPFYHSFEMKDNGFIILNTADIKGKYTGPDFEITKELLDRYKSKKNVFVFMHITPAKWTENGVDRKDIIQLFSAQQNLKAVFHGHDHDQDNYKERDGRYYFWDAHVAGNWGTAYRGYRIVEVLKDGSILTYQMNPSAETVVNERQLG